MTLDKNTVIGIARLARLELDESKLEKYKDELSNILSLVEKMNASDTTGIAPMTHPFDAQLRLREDVVTETNKVSEFQVLAPDAEDGLYFVPKVID